MNDIDRESLARFELMVLPHLDAAHNLARWLTRDDHDAVDVVQEAMMRALHGFGSYRGGDARCWLLSIVRNTCFTWLRRNRAGAPAAFAESAEEELESAMPEPAAELIRADNAKQLRSCIDDLPAEFREAFVLRELEELSYKQISQVTGVPIGTVMSRLARARSRLQQALSAKAED